MAVGNARLRELVGRDMLRGAIAALGTRAAAFAQVELLSLVKDILFQELRTSPAPSQVRLDAVRQCRAPSSLKVWLIYPWNWATRP